MQKLLDPNTVPPDGFRYFQDETRTWIRSPDYYNLFQNVMDHRKANNLPLGTFWEAEVEDQLCQQLPPGLCKESIPGQGRNIFTRVGWDAVVTGTQTLIDWAGRGLKQVDQELANKRADTCSRCYFNVAETGGCHSCGQLVKLATRFVGAKRTKADPFLKVCAVCHCSLQAKVWCPIEAIDKGAKDTSRYPSFCWIPKELEAYRIDSEVTI